MLLEKNGWKLFEPILDELDVKMREAQNDPTYDQFLKLHIIRETTFYDLYQKKNTWKLNKSYQVMEVCSGVLYYSLNI